MSFARFENLKNMKELVPLQLINGTEKIKSSGLPMAYDDKNLYIDSRSGHSLIIGSTGSGKTQTITLPLLKLSLLAGESIIVNDSTGEVYKNTFEMFKENKYNIIKLNLDDCTNTNHWNPLELAKKFYDEGNFDKSEQIIEDLGFYLLNEKEDKNVDPFWINSAVSYFTGICLYALEKENEINLIKIYDIDETIRENPEKFIKSIDKHSSIYMSLSGILTAPSETRGSIFSVFSDKFKRFIVKNNLRELLTRSDFDLANISKEKTIIYINSGKINTSNNLLPLFINQVYDAKEDNNRLNIVIDDFYLLNPIKSFAKVLNFSRSNNIVFSILIRGFNDLKNVYGKEETELLKLCFTNIVYLLSQDYETLEEFSKLCGNINQNTPLISIEELKTLNTYEAIIITTRIMPFKTKLLPYYQFK